MTTQQIEDRTDNDVEIFATIERFDAESSTDEQADLVLKNFIYDSTFTTDANEDRVPADLNDPKIHKQIPASMQEVFVVSALSKLPTMMHGEAGVGKTASVHALAELLGYDLVTVIGSQSDAADIKGLPSPRYVGKDSEGRDVNTTVYNMEQWQLEVLEKKRVIIFLDEYANAQPDVRASMLNVIQDRRFPSGNKMPDETIIIAATNAVEDSADGSDWDMPTANRFYHIEFYPTAREWVEGMRVNWNKSAPTSEMKWKAIIADFISENTSYLHRPPKDGETMKNTANGSRTTATAIEVDRCAWPSRRTWDMLSVALSRIEDFSFEPGNVETIRDNIARGLVGVEAAREFSNYRRRLESVPMEEALKDPSSVDWTNLSFQQTAIFTNEINSRIDNIRNVKEFEDIAPRVVSIYRFIATQEGARGLFGRNVNIIINRLSEKNRNLSARNGMVIPDLPKQMIALTKDYTDVLSNQSGARRLSTGRRRRARS